MKELQLQALQSVEGMQAAGPQPDWQPTLAGFFWALTPLLSLALVASHYGRSRHLLAARRKEASGG